ncbi:MAG: Gfo/Idh/MocA family oxidoreductase [Sedimentisphaerales bacterium]|nr:Gfo/Idh/MocA family oxidoreductase [Sedimentisphaerales bacterium]
MNKLNRRDFVKASLLTTAGIGLTSCTGPVQKQSRIIGANDTIRIGIVGVRSKGSGHIDDFRKLDKVKVVAICDVDEKVLADKEKKFTDTGETVDTYTDVRKMLDDKNIDAVCIATPNHWHSLIAIWACQAGKDVYCEKPISHNIFEGGKLVEAAKKYNRIVQTGTQNRSDTGLIPAYEYVHSGKLGKIQYVYGNCFKRRKSIGKVPGPQPIPDSIDYDMWIGPAPMVPLMRKELHYDWHWVWDTGCGDIGNQGVHEVDLCLWALQKTKMPSRVISMGARLGYDDDGQTANTQLAVFDYEDAPIFFEVRGLPQSSQIEDAMDHYKGLRTGVVIMCENGYFAGGRGGGNIYDNNGNKTEKFPGDGGGGHQQNFIDAMRSRKNSDLRAHITKGHLCASLCHMANTSYRLGTQNTAAFAQEQINGFDFAQKRLENIYEHLTKNDVDLEKTPLSVGPWLQMDIRKERYIEDGKYSPGAWANRTITRNYRGPFVVPDKV